MWLSINVQSKDFIAASSMHSLGETVLLLKFFLEATPAKKLVVCVSAERMAVPVSQAWYSGYSRLQ